MSGLFRGRGFGLGAVGFLVGIGEGRDWSKGGEEEAGRGGDSVGGASERGSFTGDRRLGDVPLGWRARRSWWRVGGEAAGRPGDSWSLGRSVRLEETKRGGGGLGIGESAAEESAFKKRTEKAQRAKG